MLCIYLILRCITGLVTEVGLLFTMKYSKTYTKKHTNSDQIIKKFVKSKNMLLIMTYGIMYKIEIISI